MLHKIASIRYTTKDLTFIFGHIRSGVFNAGAAP